MRERGDEDGRGIIAVAERSGIEPWRDQFYNEHSDTLGNPLALLVIITRPAQRFATSLYEELIRAF